MMKLVKRGTLLGIWYMVFKICGAVNNIISVEGGTKGYTTSKLLITACYLMYKLTQTTTMQFSSSIF